MRKNQFLRATANSMAVILSLLFLTALVSCNKSDNNQGNGNNNNNNNNNNNGNNNGQSSIDTVQYFTGTVILAARITDNPDPKCFIDLLTGKVYAVSEGAANAASIDLVWGSRKAVFSQKYLVGTSDAFIMNGSGDETIWDEYHLFKNWTRRNVTMMNNFFGPGFEDIRTREDFDEFVDGWRAIHTYISFEGRSDQLVQTFYYEINRAGVLYRGLLKIDQADMADKWAKFRIKVIKG